MPVVTDQDRPEVFRHPLFNREVSCRRELAQGQVFEVGDFEGIAKFGAGLRQHFGDESEVPLGLPQSAGVHCTLSSLPEVGDFAVK